MCNFFMNEVFMKRAIELAQKGEGFVSPNPCVGAVIVKNGKIVGEGWHKKAGLEHAEIIAIKDALKNRANLKNADLYVTLEPCCHYGKTPPCVNKIIKLSIKKIFIGMIDPFKKVNGKSVEIFKKNNIYVEICNSNSNVSKEIRALNQPFIKLAKIGLPYVIMKAGVSLDGKIATKDGQSRWITSKQARNDARFERSKCDAVLIGANTVLKDDPELYLIKKFKNKNFWKIIVDAELNCPIDVKVFKYKNVFVATTDLAPLKNKEKYRKAGVKFKSFGKKRISIEKFLRYLGKLNIQSVFVEGGSEVNGSFFDAFLKDKSMLDKIIFYIAPKLIGSKEALSVIGGEGITEISKKIDLKNFKVKMINKDIKAEGIFNFY